MRDRVPPWAWEDESIERRRAQTLSWLTIFSGLISGALVAVLTVGIQAGIDDRREDRADRREDARFVRDREASGNISRSSFQGMDLSGANLTGLNLAGVDFSKANLSNTDLTGTNLSGAILEGADLSSARLIETRLEGTNLEDAELPGAYIERAYMGPSVHETKDGTWYKQINLKRANFSRATLVSTQINGALLEHTDFSGATFKQINIEEANSNRPSIPRDLNSNIDDSWVNQIVFKGADLSGLTLFGTQVGSVEEGVTYISPVTEPAVAPHPVCYDARTRWPVDYRWTTTYRGVCPSTENRSISIPNMKPVP